MGRELIAIFVVILIILGVGLAEKLEPPLKVRTLAVLSTGGANPGDKASDFILKSLNDTDIRLSSFEGHKTMIIHFWAAETPDELGQLQSVRNFYGDKIEILVIAEKMNISTAKKAIDDLEISFPILLDKTGEVRQAFAVLTLPTTYFLDISGVIIDKKEGLLTEQELNEKVKNHLR